MRSIKESFYYEIKNIIDNIYCKNDCHYKQIAIYILWIFWLMPWKSKRYNYYESLNWDKNHTFFISKKSTS